MNHSPTARTRRERVKRGRRVLTRAAVINIKHAGLRMRWNVAPRGHTQRMRRVVRAQVWLVIGALRYVTMRLVSG